MLDPSTSGGSSEKAAVHPSGAAGSSEQASDPGVEAAAAALMFDDPSVITPLFASLPAESLVSAACVCKAWAQLEQVERAGLWRSLVLASWPGLSRKAQVNWRKRFRVLSRWGVPLPGKVEEDALANFTFCVQGRLEPGAGGGEAAQTFSSTATAHKVVRAEDCAGNLVVFRDAFELEIEIEPAVALPQSWRVEDSMMEEEGGSFRGLDVTVLVENQADETAAHLLSFSVAAPSVSFVPPAGEMQAGDERAVPLHAFWEAELPDTFVAEADVTNFPTFVGCGYARETREEVPWLKAMIGDVELGALVTPPEVVPSPLQLGFRLVDSAPRLRSIRMGLYLRTTHAQAGLMAYPLPVKDVVASEALDWA